MNFLHNVYLNGCIWTKNYLPETFTDFNKENFLSSIQEGKDQWIIKLESDQRLYSIIPESVTELENLILTYHTHPIIEEREDAKKHLQEIINKWNEIRDSRPSYVAFWGEVKDLFEPSIAHDWPDKLRDHLGLLHLDPTQNGIIQNSHLPMILMRYPVEEVLEAASLEGSTCSFAIPTVLDGMLSEAFCPSPSLFTEGRAVNLTDSVDNYNALCEVLNYRILYKAKHIFKFGWIKQPPGSLEPARSLHLEWLKNKSGHNDFHITCYNNGVNEWLATKIPAIAKVRENMESIAYYRVEKPPSKRDMDMILKLMKKITDEEFREKVKNLRFQHRKVAQETGDSDTFVRFLCNIEKNIQSNYPTLAEELVVEANICAPYDPVTWTQLGNIYRQQGNFEKGELVGWEAYHRFPENVYVHTGLAETLKAKGDIKKAEIFYLKTVDKFPVEIVPWTGLAETIKDQHRYSDAEKIYKHALSLPSSNTYVLNGLAYILKLQNNYTEAKKYYSEAIDNEPDEPVAYNGLAEVCRAQGDLEKAEELYRKSKQRFPEDAIAHVGLAVVLLKSKYEEAKSLLEEAINKFRNKNYASRILAEVKKERDDYAGAEKILNEAYENAMFKTQSYPLKLKEERVVFPEIDIEVASGVKVVGITPKAVPLPRTYHK